MTPLNENHARLVRATFAHLDSLLRDMEALTRPPYSPFVKERADLAPDEARLLESFIAMVRARMMTALDRLNLPRPEPALSARWSITTSLAFAEVALAELRLEGLRGYGDLAPETAREVEAVAEDIATLLRRGRALVHEAEPGGLTDQVASVPGEVGSILQALERLSRERGLAEVRPLLGAATERAVADSFEVGVFGRVSAGKSSLLNALAGEAVLPVGATPGTAVPVRIRRGASAAMVAFLDGGARSIPLDAIAAYATEAENPQNRLGVRAIDVTVPGVTQGLSFLDTPGVGSLARSGPAQTFAWLPRCDLGLVLVAAGSGTLSRDDIALVAGLTQAGIACRVLVSKADLLAPVEIANTVSHIARELAEALPSGRAIPIEPISTQRPEGNALARLRHDVLEPLARDRTSASREALRGRLHRLVIVTAGALAGRTEGGRAAMSLRHQTREAAGRTIRKATDALLGAAPAILEQALEAVLAAWETGTDGAPVAGRAILAASNPPLEAIGRVLVAAREGVEEPEAVRVPPLFDPAWVDTIPAIPPPRFLARPFARSLARRRLAPLAGPLQEALGRYGARLDAWARQRLDEALTAVEEGALSSADPGPLPPELADLDRRTDRALS